MVEELGASGVSRLQVQAAVFGLMATGQLTPPTLGPDQQADTDAAARRAEPSFPTSRVTHRRRRRHNVFKGMGT
jgi:hypothetical protein